MACSLARPSGSTVADFRLEELDSSVWPTLEDVRRLARRTLLAAKSAGPTSPGLHGPPHLAIVKDR